MLIGYEALETNQTNMYETCYYYNQNATSRHWLNGSNIGYGSYTNVISQSYRQVSIFQSAQSKFSRSVSWRSDCTGAVLSHQPQVLFLIRVAEIFSLGDHILRRM